jgi:hypothetical protein
VLHIVGCGWLAVGRRLLAVAGCCHSRLVLSCAVLDEVGSIRRTDSVRRIRLMVVVGLAVTATLQALRCLHVQLEASVTACTPHGASLVMF